MSKNIEAMKMDINDLIEGEFVRGLMEHGGFNSPHEAYAVIKEETEEAAQHFKRMEQWLEELWVQVKNDKYEAIEELAGKVQQEAEGAIAELAQVAAVAKKAGMGKITKIAVNGREVYREATIGEALARGLRQEMKSEKAFFEGLKREAPKMRP